MELTNIIRGLHHLVGWSSRLGHGWRSKPRAHRACPAMPRHRPAKRSALAVVIATIAMCPPPVPIGVDSGSVQNAPSGNFTSHSAPDALSDQQNVFPSER